MARNQRFMPVPPQAVFDVLSDPGSYGYWVAGSKEIRDADPEWPEPGSRFHHTVGFGPLTIRDHTTAEESERPRRIVLRAKARPLGTAKVTLELEARDGGTEVTMTEDAGDAVSLVFFGPATHLLTRWRNAESLMRLEELALRAAAERGGKRKAPTRAQAPSSA